jgi:eukaryotic-like serine/threonine-protein kinase
MGVLRVSTGLVSGRYRLLNVIGAGGMGRVWLAEDELLDRRVAIKEINVPVDAGNTQMLDVQLRTVREARAAAKLVHPAVVTVFDVVWRPGQAWIVMEYVPSRSLHDAIKQDGPLSHPEAARIGLQVLGGLRAAHVMGVLHRDVKPHNVLLAHDGRVVLTDFGLATFEGAEKTSDLLMGSPHYVAPERLSAEAEQGEAADLWSLGATLYTAVEGRPPFARATTQASLGALLHEPPDEPEHPGLLTPVIMALLAKDPAVRPAPARVEEALHRIITPIPRQPGAGAGVEPATRPDPARPPARPVSPAPVYHPLSGGPVYSPGSGAPDPVRPVGIATSSGNPISGAPAGRSFGSAAPVGSSGSGSGGSVGSAAPISAVPTSGGAARGSAAVGPLSAPPRSTRPRRGTVIAAVAAVAALAAGIGTTVALAGENNGKDRTAAKPPAGTSTAKVGTGTAPAFDPCGFPSAGAVPVGPTNTTPPMILSAGWVWHADTGGFALPLPEGWRQAIDGTVTCFRDPKGTRAFTVDSAAPDTTSPLTYWQTVEKTEKTLPGYRKLGMAVLPLKSGAADYEYSWTAGGVQQHTRRVLVATSPGLSYLLQWTTTDRDWTANLPVQQRMVTGFRQAS